MNNKNISIIVPVYNVDKWLNRCLMSIQRQTYKNFEALLIDDGSNDNSCNICKKYANQDKRFKYFRKENGGLSDARNYGLDRVNGKYIIFIDSDDYVEEDYVKKLFETITKFNADIAICGFSNVKTDGSLISENLLPMTNKNTISGIKTIELSFNYQNLGWSLGCAWNKIYLSSLFDNVRFEKGRYYEDGLIFPFLFLNVSKVAIIHEALYDYVQRDNSIMHSTMTIKKIKDDDYSMHRWIDLFSRKNKKLYILSVQKYKDWIINRWINYRSILRENDMSNYLQLQFRKYGKVGQASDVKRNIRDILGFINLNILYYIAKIMS